MPKRVIQVGTRSGQIDQELCHEVSIRRDQILERCFRNEIAPDTAEKAVRKLGLKSFEHTPSSDEFPPEGERYWRFPMVIAWIIWREIEPVRMWWDEYRLQRRYWTQRDFRQGWDLSQGQRLSVHNLLLAEASHLPYTLEINGDFQPRLSLQDACMQLHYALQTGKVEARAISIKNNRPESIEPEAWWHLIWAVCTHSDRRGNIDTIATKDWATTRHQPLILYSEPILEQRKVREFWPSSDDTQCEQAPGSQSDQHAKSPPIKPPKRQPGRPRKYDRDAFATEVTKRVQRDGPPVSARAFADEMQLWCGEEWGEEPCDSTIRDWLRYMLAPFRTTASK